ncbi:MAG: hypothetical protein V3R64_03040 [Sphingomonadales bacterium]
MATFFPRRAFVKKKGKIYFFRAKSGPTYEVTAAEKEAIIALTHKLHWKMSGIIALAFSGFGIFILFLPQILTLTFDLALAIMIALILASLAPLGLTLRFHLTHQKQIRGVLGKKTSIEFSMKKLTEKEPEVRKNMRPQKDFRLMEILRNRERQTRFFWVFFLGIIITTVGLTMLISIEEPSTKMIFIWVLNLMTGVGLLLVGFLGLVYRLKDSRSAERRHRK